MLLMEILVLVLFPKESDRRIYWKVWCNLGTWLAAMIFAVLLGIPIGVIAALKRNSVVDTDGLVSHRILDAYFLVGNNFNFNFPVNLGLTPVSGRISVSEVDRIAGFMLIDSLFSEDGIGLLFCC